MILSLRRVAYVLMAVFALAPLGACEPPPRSIDDVYVPGDGQRAQAARSIAMVQVRKCPDGRETLYEALKRKLANPLEQSRVVGWHSDTTTGNDPDLRQVSFALAAGGKPFEIKWVVNLKADTALPLADKEEQRVCDAGSLLAP